jgi:serine/threonine protein kinase
LAEDFFLKMVNPDPTERFTANLALSHPWITGKDDLYLPLSTNEYFNNFDKMKSFFYVKYFLK